MQSFSPCPSVLSRPGFEVSTSWFSTNLGGNILSKIQQEKNLYVSVLNSFLSFFVSILWVQHHHRALREKRTAFQSPRLAGGWRVLGPCVVVHRILASFFSLYIGLRDYTVSLCEYGQLAFTNMYLSTFSCLIKRKKKEKKGGYRR